MKLLVVEDEHKIAHAIKSVLVIEGFVVDVINDGEAGLQAATFETYDLLILDRALPGLDGLDICREVRKQDRHIPILLLTAKDQVHQRIEGLNAGADDYLIKPFSMGELLARIRALLRRPQTSIGDVLEIGDLELDITQKKVRRSGQPVRLSAKEFALLEYLMRHKGHVLSKQRLIDHVWDFDADILPNTVESFIGFLRTKIDKPFVSPPLIHTIRGFGYTIDDQP